MAWWNRKPNRPTQPPQPPPLFECRLSVWKEGKLTTEGVATLRLDQFPGQVFTAGIAPEAPRLLFKLPANTAIDNGGNFSLTGVEGYQDIVWRRCLTGHDLRVADRDNASELDGAVFGDLALTLPVSKDFDPSTVPLRDVARIRGGMWTKLPFELVARPDQPRARDIAAPDFLWNYNEQDRLTMVRHLTDVCKYTHAEVGPVVDSDGYHGTWTPRNWIESMDAWNQWMDMHQYLWNNGLCPVSFIVPDGWSLERAKREITPFLQTERAQRLIRVAVIAWEPGGDYSWSSFTWAGFAKWLRETLPNAAIFMHNASKADGSAPDGPVGGDSAGTDENNDPEHNGANNVGRGFARVAPYLHGWLIQTGEYYGPVSAASKNGVALNQEEWGAMFRSDAVGARYHSIDWHLKHGIGDWPRGSAWGPDESIWLIDAEHAAYARFWKGETQAHSNTFGDYAVQCGAKGALDGISPETVMRDGPVPWARVQ